MQNSLQFFLLLLTLVTSIPGYSQERTIIDFAETGKMTAWMKTNLTLSESQAAPVEDINVEYEHRNLVLLTGYLTRKQLEKIAKYNEQKRDEELKKILSAEQFEAWLARKKEIEAFNSKLAQKRVRV
jgi:hypothetical protein